MYLGLLSRALGLAIDPLLNRTLVVDASVSSFVSSHVTADVLPTLATMTGAEWSSVSSSDLTGVVRVVKATTGDECADAADVLGLPQSYVIDASLTGDTLIVGGGARGCLHGLYAWLRALGVRWLLPGADWQVTPPRSDVRLSLHVVRHPAIQTVQWSPQGFGNAPFDVPARETSDWYAWGRRNSQPLRHNTGSTGGITDPARQAFGGHMGLWAAKPTEMSANALHFAEVDGVRRTGTNFVNYSHNGDTNGVEDEGDITTYDGLVKVWGDWNAQKVNYYAANNTHVEMLPAFSAEPPDSNTHCNCAKCLNLVRAYGVGEDDSTPSDRVMHLASRLGARLAETAPGYRASVFAYNQHSLPPSIPIDPNVIVLAAAYGYVNAPVIYEDLLDTWKAKADTDGFALGIYDYWSLPAWHLGHPSFPLRSALDRVRAWAGHGLEAFVGESTTGTGSIGLHWHAAMRLVEDPTLTDEEIVDEFFSDAFGSAAEHARKLWDRWFPLDDAAWSGDYGYRATAYEFGEAYADLLAAYDAAESDAVRRRVSALIQHVEYLRLYAAWTASKSDETAGALLTHLWRGWVWGVVQTRYVHDVVIADNALSSEFVDQWTIPAANQYATWRSTNSITDYTPAEMRDIAAAGAVTWPRLALTGHTVPSSTLVAPFTPTGTTPKETVWMAGDEGPIDGHLYAFYANGQAGVLELQARASGGSGHTKAEVRVTLTRADGTVVSEETIRNMDDTNANVRQWTIASLTPGVHFLRVYAPSSASIHRLYARGDLPIVRLGCYTRANWNSVATAVPRYFFVPRGVQRFAYYASSTSGLKFFDDAGTEVTPTSVGLNTYTVDVAEGHDHAVWRCEGVGAVHRFHGVPNITAPSAAQLLVPANLWAE